MVQFSIWFRLNSMKFRLSFTVICFFIPFFTFYYYFFFFTFFNLENFLVRKIFMIYRKYKQANKNEKNEQMNERVCIKRFWLTLPQHNHWKKCFSFSIFHFSLFFSILFHIFFFLVHCTSEHFLFSPISILIFWSHLWGCFSAVILFSHFSFFQFHFAYYSFGLLCCIFISHWEMTTQGGFNLREIEKKSWTNEPNVSKSNDIDWVKRSTNNFLAFFSQNKILLLFYIPFRLNISFSI